MCEKKGLRGRQARVCFLILIFAISLSVPASTKAGFITILSADVTLSGNGNYDYTYTLTNTPQSTISAYAFGLVVDNGANLQSISEPSGWIADYTAGASTITWSTGTALIPGSSALFSFLSAEPASLSSYQATGFDPTEVLFYTNSGTVLAPGLASVPEPSSFILLVTIFPVLLGRGWWKAKREQIEKKGQRK
jgi:hypothetical protein